MTYMSVVAVVKVVQMVLAAVLVAATEMEGRW